MSSRKLRSSRDSVLSKLHQKKKTLEKSRLRVVTELERIDNSLKRIEAECGKMSNDSSPLLNLPTEVTCMIFDLAVASHSIGDYNSKKKPLLPEVVISHVCKQWRDVSLSYPQLWTRFFFRANNVELIRNSVNRFDLYIKRSKFRNLELYIDFREDALSLAGQTTRQAEQFELLGMAVRVVERWKIVTVLANLDLRIEAHFGLKLLTTSAPNLQYFAYSPDSVCGYPFFLDPRMQRSLGPEIFQGGASKLQYLLLDSSTLRIPPSSNITTLRIEIEDGMPDTDYTWKEFLEMLSMPSLTNLSMVGTFFDVPEASGIPTIPMNNLKHLRYSDNEYMTLLLPFLRAPRLETLTIRNDEGLDEDFEPNPFGLMEEDYAFPLLHTLTLIDATTPSPDLAWRFMNLTENITSLFISHDSIVDDTFLTRIQEHGPLDNQCWPKLTTITAHFKFDYRHEVDVLSDFVFSRPNKSSFKLRLLRQTFFSWETGFLGRFARLKGKCIIEVLGREEEAETVLMRPMWPPGADCPDYAFRNDPFELEKAFDIAEYDFSDI